MAKIEIKLDSDEPYMTEIVVDGEKVCNATALRLEVDLNHLALEIDRTILRNVKPIEFETDVMKINTTLKAVE